MKPNLEETPPPPPPLPREPVLGMAEELALRPPGPPEPVGVQPIGCMGYEGDDGEWFIWEYVVHFKTGNTTVCHSKHSLCDELVLFETRNARGTITAVPGYYMFITEAILISEVTYFNFYLRRINPDSNRIESAHQVGG